MPCHADHSHALQGKALYSTLFIAGIFFLIEITGGYIAHSLALYSDALHLLMDVGALLLSIFVLKVAHLPRTPTMSYGYHRAEILGALANALSLCVICAFFIYEALHRLFQTHFVNGGIVFVVAAIGLIANVIMIKKLHPTRSHNLNMRALYLHILGDLLGSIAVLASGAILWFTHWYPIDALISLLFTASIFYSSWKLIVQSIKILMESTPEGVDPLALERDLKDIVHVEEVHDLHVWTVSSKRIALSAHLVSTSPQQTLKEAHHMLEKKHGIRHMTIQVEDPSSFEAKFCYDCEQKYT
ncbi:MAG TPA: cation diffusion facilitator family transporter [Rhabdochlamydiaceae bacterium]|jgi:cobalt-zinc-cadmium efflux system protein